MSTFRLVDVSTFSDVTALPVDPSAQPLTRDLVADDEVIILLLRPSLLYVFLSCFYNLIFIALATFALAYMAKFMSQLPGIGWNDTQAFALGVALGALRVGWQFLEWMCKVYILTDRRVIARSGVLRVVVFQSQLKKIQHTAVFASLRERTTGLGTIGFATAGSDTFEAFWSMIREPFAVHKKVVETIERYAR
jgi:uncharacterized membrane protein YdbT with pleckstrin-like domain